ncbi:hypothetical protein [Zeaxanthinibacter enoshimensis]|uniref:Calx-beta domain-containing protein n=1 Tax=Zeaxanthinibacter enoshimensis TaxID=392009 RepID=A0A4R6TIC0_9FLAO|nr:hypothetical protein [Zeaxanthinibacter enoshimensis]TDQ28990.1 hypothetical protein CLV82_2439 [Zeaxanthinibacter enoshimensis]
MRNILYTVIAMALVFTGCTEDYDLDERGLSVEELPAYVAFSAPGASSSIAPVDTAEDAGSVSLNVEIPGGTVSNVTVTYGFSGSAVFGEDFTVDGADSAGGTVIISKPGPEANLDGLPPNADIDITLLTDGVADGAKTLEVTLLSASNGQGTVEVGRGGTASLRSQTVNIADVD